MNTIGTILLLIANVIGGMISQSAMQVMLPGGNQFAGRGDFSGQGRFTPGAGQSNPDVQSGADVTQAAGFGMLSNVLLRGAINTLVLAVMFYAVLSLSLERFVKGQKAEKARSKG